MNGGPSIRSRLETIALTGGAILALVVLYQWDPAVSGMYPSCPFQALTGWYCPGCGTLRAIHHLLHGRIFTAMGFNALAILTLPFMGYALVSEAARGLIGRGLPGIFIPAAFIWAYLALVLVFGILRNIPYGPLSWLAP
ncbi:MAG: DUF2752 domain-containing protein [Proteobacteria bacterium]|nr:DUF2752 domain-containing protein [Pseudomonadota bacterium]